MIKKYFCYSIAIKSLIVFFLFLFYDEKNNIFVTVLQLKI